MGVSPQILREILNNPDKTKRSTKLKMKSVLVTFLLSLLIGGIVGRGNKGRGSDVVLEAPAIKSLPKTSSTELDFTIRENGAQRQTRQAEQSFLGCMMGCTRELRPVRGEQGGNERLFANKCAFNIERCRAQVQRKPSLLLSKDQSEIHWPTVN